MTKPTQIQSYIHSIKSLHAGSWRITIDTDERVKPGVIDYLGQNVGKPGFFIHLVDRQIEIDDLKEIPDIKKTQKGSPSQQLRFTMKAYFGKIICNEKPFTDEEFQTWYEGQIEVMRQKYITAMSV
jgi:hypothetical protein